MMKLKIIFFLFAFLSFNAFAVKAFTQTQPFRISVIEKPAFVVAGEKYKITVGIKNRSSKVLTLSSLYALSTDYISWRNKDGSGGGVGFGSGGGKLIIGTIYNPETKEFICKYFHYDENDFFTLPVNGTKQLEVEFEVPEEVPPLSIITVEISYESKYDGSEIGLKAWTGEAKTLKVRIPTQRAKTEKRI